MEPDLNECCGNGCTPCVFDTYADEKRRWRDAVKAWDLRHPAPEPDDAAPDAPARPHCA
jgi:hypothetical protein